MPKKKKKYITKKAIVPKKELKTKVEAKVADTFFETLARKNGNTTEAAMEVFGYTEDQRWQANIVGKRMLQRLAPSRDAYISYQIERKTGGIDWFIDQMLDKVASTKTTDWWDRAMKLAGYYDFTNKTKDININVGTTHEKYAENYIDGDEDIEDE